MATLQQAIDQIQALVGALDGIQEAPEEPPDNLGARIYSLCYASSGSWEYLTPGWKKGMHTIVLQLHVARATGGGLERAIQKAMGYSESIPDAIMVDQRLNNTVEAIVHPINYTFGELNWAGKATIGFSFEITIKQETAISS